MIDLDRIEKLAREATPGAWAYDDTGSDRFVTRAEDMEHEGGRLQIAIMPGWDREYRKEEAANATYIASVSPSVVLKLVAVARAAKNLTDEVEADESEWPNFAALVDALSALTTKPPT